MTTAHTQHGIQKTGYPPGMLQDDDKKLSKWLANRIDSRMHAREAAELIQHNSDGSDRDAPLVEPYNIGYIAGGALALVLWTALICGLAGYWVGS